MAISRIMIVDDNEAEHFLYKHAIRKFDPDIVLMSAYDGEEALDLLQNASEMPDCLIVDINMPRMGGVEFLRVFGEKFAGKDIVVVIMTSSLLDQDRDEVMAHDFVGGFFTKPLDQDDLARLQDMVAGR